MEREFIINYENLDNFISQQQNNPDRTDWELTMLRNNLKKIKQNLDEFRITINETIWEIKIEWETDIENKFKTIPTGYDESNKNKIYHQIKQSIEEAKSYWVYNQIFSEIKE